MFTMQKSKKGDNSAKCIQNFAKSLHLGQNRPLQLVRFREA